LDVRQAVSNDKAGTALHQRQEGILDFQLGERIDGRRRPRPESAAADWPAPRRAIASAGAAPATGLLPLS
jgi:hypothetical protein